MNACDTLCFPQLAGWLAGCHYTVRLTTSLSLPSLEAFSDSCSSLENQLDQREGLQLHQEGGVLRTGNKLFVTILGSHAHCDHIRKLVNKLVLTILGS